MTDESDVMHAATRFSISALSWTAYFVIGYASYKIATSPNSGRAIIMRAVKFGENYSMRQAQRWANRAAKCETLYKQTSGVLI